MTLAIGATLAATEARAGDVTASGDRAAGGPYTSIGSAPLRYEQTKGLPTDIGTGFIGPAWAQVNVRLRIDPVQNGGPLFVVDMPKGALVEAVWGADKKILLRAQTGTESDGLVTVRHTLTPSIDFKIDVQRPIQFQAELGFDASALVNKLPGSRFNYDSRASQTFAPWGFLQVDTVVNAPDMKNATLFSLEMKKLPELVSKNIDGYFGVRASTKPTFSYRTSKILLTGANGEIDSPSSELVVDAVDGDFMELMSTVEGVMNVKGAIGIQPFVHLDRIASWDMDTDLGIDVFQQQYNVEPTVVTFQTALVHIPLPNVHVPQKGIDMGEVALGASISKTIAIENSGEKEATLELESSDAAFRIATRQVTVPPKSTHELVVKFSPENTNPSAAEITVTSSDPDSPRQTFRVGANGADVGQDDGEGGASRGARADEGCGCTAAGARLPAPAGFGVVAVAFAALVRRRRKGR
jgi:MYXO-CTERM domain-containing protein